MACPRPSTVAEAIERDARVLAAVEGGKKQVEVAAELGVTAARICQIVRRARDRRARLCEVSAVPA
jgi:transcriptional regulator